LIKLETVEGKGNWGTNPLDPQGFNALACSDRKHRTALGEEDRPVCRVQGSSRRSGCVPAEPYPPLEQREGRRICSAGPGFPFPLPGGCIGAEGETGGVARVTRR